MDPGSAVGTISIRSGVVAFLPGVEPSRPHILLSSSDEEVVGRRLSDLHSSLQTTTTTTTVATRAPRQRNVPSRRDLLMAATGVMGRGLVFSTIGSICPLAASAAPLEGVLVAAPSASLPSGLLDSRVQGNVLAPPPYGMEGPDIFYPEYVSAI
jgi:hypothetical protein